jgi:hypothetical protein
MQHADKEDESCAQRGIRGGYYCAPSSSIQFTTLEPELLNGKQMEIYCPRADAATTISTASATANIARDYKGKKSRRRIRHKRELLVSQMEEEEEEEEKLGTFVHYLFSPPSFFPIQFFFCCQSLSLSTTTSFTVCSRHSALVVSYSGQ